MKKKYDNGMLKTELSADGKIIHFSLKVTDLKKLFKCSPENYDGSNIKRGKEQDFKEKGMAKCSKQTEDMCLCRDCAVINCERYNCRECETITHERIHEVFFCNSFREQDSSR